MFKSREYIGISLEGDHLKIARIKPQKKGFELLRLDKLKLIDPIKSGRKESALEEDVSSEDVFSEEDSDDIFGLDLEDEDEDDDSGLDELTEIDLDDLDDSSIEDFDDTDLVEESSVVKTNEELLVQYLDDFKKSKVTLALNIESGNTIFQIVKNENFKEQKKKEVQQAVVEKLQAIYGSEPNKDLYEYFLRENGNLVIASIDEESPTLQLVSSAGDRFGENYYINDVVPDEVAMVGLFRNHYEKDEKKITGLVQFSPDKCRMVFVRGHEILQVSPVINEGTKDKNFLNTIFSKVLFQLDTGEIPGLDRFVIFNNTVGEDATDFFRKNFPDLKVEDFRFDKELVTYGDTMKDIVPGFTTAIGIASVAANVGKSEYPEVSFLPEYVSDRQKIFKLQWHGFILLILIGASPVILNHFYQANVAEIDQLQQQNNRLQSDIQSLQPLVEESEDLTMKLGQMQNQLELLGALSAENIKWSVTIDHFNQAAEEVGGLWINSFRQNNDVLMVDGYSLNRERIPMLANQFDSVTLLSVQREEVREREVFYFNMMIRSVIDDTSRYTPENVRSLNDLIN
ncbi:PilN domain-containing protein [Rhodohalobacter sp.]|uniref:PilN domain-containing protein n=1 Tax=Rhodohalobacter sp. TaxID=1974210 RepID=UPI002ACD5F21|nr:PilN domain-containing protein [Rhodohalobacter sp.]MDZ7757440.1 PilN domain-containing protein [Rhodohalobacter sp.]